MNATARPCAVTLRRIETAATAPAEGLVDLLIDVVRGGASVGFLWPLDRTGARDYWRSVLAALGDGLLLWVAESGPRVLGTVQLAPCLKANGRHRAELQKLLVQPSARGQGIASRLMAAVEAEACARGLTLLVLDTLVGSAADPIYRHLGWQHAGSIPDYAAAPDGTLHATAVFYKRLP
jgi:GNAT superfamily N-acetyltransferase